MATSSSRRFTATCASPTSTSTGSRTRSTRSSTIKTFVAMQAVRPLSLSSALDIVFAHSDFRDHVAAENVVGFGASLGGESLLLMGGAALTTTLGQSSSRVTLDPRLKAAVGYVPYFGIDVYPAFGRDLKGLDGVTLPYLALSGTADTTAPISVVEAGMNRLAGTRQLVALTGPRAWLRSRVTRATSSRGRSSSFAGSCETPPSYRATSARMTEVAGGMADVQRIDYMAPAPVDVSWLQSGVVEYRNDALDHYLHHRRACRDGDARRRRRGARLAAHRLRIQDAARGRRSTAWPPAGSSARRRWARTRTSTRSTPPSARRSRRIRCGRTRAWRSTRTRRWRATAPTTASRCCGSTTTGWAGRPTTATRRAAASPARCGTPAGSSKGRCSARSRDRVRIAPRGVAYSTASDSIHMISHAPSPVSSRDSDVFQRKPFGPRMSTR